MTAARIVVRGATTAISRRTTLRKSFLAPWHELVDQCWLYALADAQRRTGMAIHHGVRVVTHHHLSVTPSEPNTGQFLQLFHRDLSHSLNHLLARERYDRPRDVFDKRSTHCMRLVDADAQAEHLVYERLNPVAAGLVRSPDDMPGVVLDLGRWKTDGVLVKRPPVYFGQDRPEELMLELTPPPLLYRTYGGDLNALVYAMQRLEDWGTRALKRALRGRGPLGAEGLRRLHPWGEPVTAAEPPGQPIPTFKVGARGLLDVASRQEALAEVRAWRRGYSSAKRRHDAEMRQPRGSNMDAACATAAIFPYGTYEMRRRHHVRVAEADLDALVAAPGPLLQEVKDELDRCPEQRNDPTERAMRHELSDTVREAFGAGALDHTVRSLLEFEPNVNARGPTDRPAAFVQHRRSERPPRNLPVPARLIVLRDVRPATRPAGADPPP